jgi:4'-phosphopantetheinyl transferase
MHVPSLEHGAVHIWRLSLDRPQAEIDRDSRLLSTDEAARAARFVFPEHRNRYIACRASLRRLLGEYLGASTGDLTFQYNEFGKPEISNSFDAQPLRFNVSHCDHWALVALTLEQRIGIDLERLRQLEDLEHIAKNCFSELEFKTLLSAPESRRTEAFFNCWTRKEAFIKAWGDGISHPLSEFDVTLLPHTSARLLRIGGEPTSTADWSLTAWQPVPGYVAAMAIDRAALHVIYCDTSR